MPISVFDYRYCQERSNTKVKNSLDFLLSVKCEIRLNHFKYILLQTE